jgi:hypothetical protein
LQAFETDGFQVIVQEPVQAARSLGLLLHHLDQGVERGPRPERRTAGEQLVQHRPQGVDVGRGRQARSAGGLLGGHVARRAHNAAHWPTRVGLRQNVLGQAEVGDVRLPVRVEEDVGRLQIAVQQPALVGVVNSSCHDGHQPGGPDRLRVAADGIGQAAAVDEVHAEVVLAVVLADLVDGDEVRVLEVAGRLGLEAEPLHLLGGRQLARPDHLQGDGAVQANLPGAPDDAHAALGDLLQQLVVAEIAHAAESRRPMGQGGPFVGTCWHGQLAQFVVVGEEGGQLRRQIGVALEQLLAVEPLSSLHCFQVSGDHLVQRLLPASPVVVRVTHGPSSPYKRLRSCFSPRWSSPATAAGVRPSSAPISAIDRPCQ